MPHESMTPRERWLTVLNREKPDRIPMDFWSTPEVIKKLIDHLGCETYEDALKSLHIDFVARTAPKYIGPALPSRTDVFGIKTRPINYGTGVYDEATNSPLASFQSVKEIEANYQWPDPDWWDYSNIKDQVEKFRDYPIQAGGSEPMLTYKQLRGEEQAMMDLALNPDIVEYCINKLFNLSYQHTLRMIEQFPPDICPTLVYVAEDLGGQRNLMYSPRHIKRFLFPGMKHMIDLAHEAGAFAFHHDDGNITKILPDLIELGIDILNPIQWRAEGMDRQTLKNQYGDQLIFHGAVDNQYTLPFGTTDEVREEVIENIRVLGKDGGYIIAPCHNIQPNTPVENIIAMYETGYEAGWVE